MYARGTFVNDDTYRTTSDNASKLEEEYIYL